MDEYLFTVLAKLKADRLRLEREARDQKIEQLDDYYQEAPAHRSPRARRSSAPAPDLSSVVPMHGVRGWS